MKRPNLLFIFTDEQRADTMAAYGNHRIETPNLNRLASQSTIFERAYVTQPVCTPSRSSILTGLYPHTTGCTRNNIPLPADVLCLPEMLSEGEYVTAYHGKWHLGDEIFAQHGFDEWRSIEDGYRKYYSPGRDPESRSTYHGFLIDNGFTPSDGRYFTRSEAARLPEEFGKPAYLAREASRFIRENRNRPFILFVNFLEPHMPFFGPRDGQYDPSDVALPGNFEAIPTDDQPLKTRLMYRAFRERGYDGFPLHTEEGWRRLIANYWGLCSLVDTHVGTILSTLEECGLSDNTIVVYTSDHGDMMGSHRLLTKCVMFEEAVRVPLLIRLPGQTTSMRVRSPASQIDLVPTLLDLMGQPVPSHLQGKSLRPVLEDPGRADRDDVFIEWNGHDSAISKELRDDCLPAYVAEIATREEAIAAVTASVRTIITHDGWKFNCSLIGEHELYNLNEDPLETTNLAGRGDLRSLMGELTERIRRWQDRTADTVEIPSPLFQ